MGPEDGFESAICQTKVDGNATEARVKAFWGTTRLDDEATWSGVSMRDVNKDEKDDYSN